MSKLVDFSALSEMLYGDDRYIKEFADAAILSFSEFNTHYSKFLATRDEDNFRKAGHKIKPVAQMLGLQLLIDEYEHGKALIWKENPKEDLSASIAKVDSICCQVLNELENMTADN